MKREFLVSLGLDAEKDKEKIDKIMAEHGNDVEAKKTTVSNIEKKLEEANNQVSDLSKQVKDLEGSGEDIEKLKTKVAEYEQAEKDRIETEKKANDDKTLTDAILETIKEKEFVNDRTKNSIISEIKESLADPENKGKGVSDIFESLTKDQDGIFKNPHEPLELPGANGGINDGGIDPSDMSFEQYKNWRTGGK